MDRRFLKATGAAVLVIGVYVALAHLKILGVSPYESGQHTMDGIMLLGVYFFVLAFMKRPMPFWLHIIVFASGFLIRVATILT